MAQRDEGFYAGLVSRLFCGPEARHGPFSVASDLEIVVPDLIVRVPVHRPGDESESYELSIFDRVAGLAGELWEQQVRSLLRLEALDHPALPKIVSGGWDQPEEIAFSVTDISGTHQPADDVIGWAKDRPIEAFEQFSMVLDALRELHQVHIIHRNITPATLRVEMRNGAPTFRLSGFELSTLVGNILRQAVRHRDDASLDMVRSLYKRQQDGMHPARHLAYLAPEICDFVLGSTAAPRNNWETTDVFGLGVIGWEWFCGAIPAVLPDEYQAVQDAVNAEEEARDQAKDEARTRIRSALAVLHEAMAAHLTRSDHLPRPLIEVFRHMLDRVPTGRRSSFDLCREVEDNWEAIRGVWETEKNKKPYLLAYIPEDFVPTVYEARQWVSRSPEDAAGRDELRLFFERELSQAQLVRSPTGAVGYATGPDDDLRKAEWVLVGEQAVWFCGYYYPPDPLGKKVRQYIHQIMVIRYVKDKDVAEELASARPRRRVGRIDLRPFNSSQNLKPDAGRPSWRELADSLERSRRQDSKNVEFLQSMDFLLKYQETEQEARQYPFERVPDADEGRGITAITVARSRDDEWVDRSSMLAAYAADPKRRPPFGDFLSQPDGADEIVKIEFARQGKGPYFGGSALSATVLEKLDQDTIKIKMDRGAAVPATGWVRRASDNGSREQLYRQALGRNKLEKEPGLIRNLREPFSLDLGLGTWKRICDNIKLSGDAPQRISNMLSYHPFYALQGPPGSGKTTVAAHAVDAFLGVEQGARVLVSAQSNFTLDNLAARVIEKLPDNVLTLRIKSEYGAPPEPPVDEHTLDKLTETVAENARQAVTALIGGSALSAAEKTVADEWLTILDSVKIELSDRISVSASVVFATCSMAATLYDEASQAGRSFDWVIVEEAAKAWPTELIVPLVLGTRWTLIGDHKQLGAFRSEEVERFLGSLDATRTSDEELRRHHEVREDRLNALALFRELFSDKHGSAHPSRHVHAVDRLTWQFRMHPDIAEPVGRAFYPVDPPELDADRLPVSFLRTFSQEPDPHGVGHPEYLAGHSLVWIDTSGVPGFEDKRYWSNEGEVALIARLVQQMVPAPAEAGAPGDEDGSLVVLTPYRAQVRLLEQMGELRGRVHTVHSFQGREADRVIVSLVRSQPHGSGGTPMQNVGHVGTDEVVNVLLSRARRLCVLVGSLSHFKAYGGPTWDIVTRAVERYGKVVKLAEVDLP